MEMPEEFLMSDEELNADIDTSAWKTVRLMMGPFKPEELGFKCLFTKADLNILCEKVYIKPGKTDYIFLVQNQDKTWYIYQSKNNTYSVFDINSFTIVQSIKIHNHGFGNVLFKNLGVID